MAQTGYTPILIYSSSTVSQAPAVGNLTNSTLGSELAINITDGKLFYKDNANAIQVIAWKVTPTTAGGTGLTTYTAGDLLYYASGTTLTKLAIGTAYQALQVNAGGTAPSWQPSATSVLTAQGDLLYASAANTLARLAKNTTATRYLANTGSSNNPQWDQVNLANGVTGTLPVGNGGTGTATAFTAGSVVFAGASGVFSENNAQFFWDNTNTRLGVGTASPSDKIHVSAANPRVRVNNTSGTASNLVLAADSAVVWLGNENNQDLYFVTNNTERARVNSAGDWLVAKNVVADTTVGAVMRANGRVTSTLAASTGADSSYHLYSTGAGAYRFYVDLAGTVFATNTTITAISDQRLKENIRDLDAGLPKIMALKPRKFDWKQGKGKDIKDDRGWIAQEFEQVFPDMVAEWKDPAPEGEQPYKSVRADLIPVLVKAIQEQQAMIDELKAQMAVLNTQQT